MPLFGVSLFVVNESISHVNRAHLNLSIQSIPFGSSFEYTKQLNAARNGSPHGPCAIPPRHGQSQFISPVSSLKAPCWLASSSYSSGVRGGLLGEACSGIVAVIAEVGCDESEGGERDSVEVKDELVALLRFEWRMESTVGRVVSSAGVSAIGTGGLG